MRGKEKISCTRVSPKQNSGSRRKASDRKREGVCRRKKKEREGGVKEVCEEGREGRRESENGAGSWCRCAESCSFFPKLDGEQVSGFMLDSNGTFFFSLTFRTWKRCTSDTGDGTACAPRARGLWMWF